MVRKVVRETCNPNGGGCTAVRIYRCEKCGKEYEDFAKAMDCEKSHNKE